MTTTIRRGETSRGNMREEDGSDDGEMDDAELLAQLDDDFELSGLRERRLEELRRESVSCPLVIRPPCPLDDPSILPSPKTHTQTPQKADMPSFLLQSRKDAANGPR